VRRPRPGVGADRRQADALIDDQISAHEQAEERRRILDEKLARLAEAQKRTDEQIRLLITRDRDMMQ